jgi:hypothetical protein
VTYKLAALRFRSVGERSARFQDLTLTFTAPADGGSEPQDSVIWLRNGGGKSSILSLLYALLLPRAADFMGRAVKRSLTDYIDGGDTAHVVAVWEPAGASRTLLGEGDGLLVTGAVHEWADLRRPAQPEASRDRLSTLFYTFHVVPGAMDLTTLPFTDATGRIRRLAEYEAALKEQARPCDRQARLVATGKQHQWRGALGDRHLDSEVFRSQKQMNHVEGGVEDLFRFSTAQEFIDFLLDLTVAPDSVTGIATRLGQVSKQLAAKPAKQDEQSFCTRAATDLDGVASGHADVDQAVAAANQAGVAAAALAASFQAAISAADSEQERLLEEEDVARKAATAANNERNQANDLAYLYRREAARLRLGEAEAAWEEAKGIASAATASARAWEVVPSLAGLAGLKADLDRAEKEAAAEEADLAPLRAEHAQHAARLRHRLEELATKADAKELTADSKRRVAAQAVTDEKERAEKARQEEREAREAATKARGRLEELDNRRRWGVTRGHLPDLATPPAEHREIVGGIRDGLTDRLAELAEQASERRTQRESLRNQERQLITDWNTADHELSTATAARRSLGERLDALCDSPRIRELAEASEGESIMLWVESPVILRRLSDAILAADDERIRRRAERHADERTIAEHDRSQFLPSSLDADQVRDALTAVTAAQTGWEHLRDAVAPRDLLALLDTPAIARLGSGVVVPTTAADDAVVCLEGAGIRTTSLVSVYTAADAGVLIAAARAGASAEHAPAWTALRRGLVDQDEAAATVRFLKERAQAAQREDAELARRRDADRALRETVVTFLEDCPAGRLEAIDAAIADWGAKRRGVEEAQRTAQNDLKGLDEEDRAADKESAEISTTLRKVDSTLDWLDELIPALREEESLRQALSEEEEHAAKAAKRASDHAERQVTAAEEAQKQEAAARAAADEAGRYRSDAALLATGESAVVVVPDPAVPLDALRQNEAGTRAALERRAAQSVLADRARSLAEQVAKTRAEIARHPAELQRHAHDLLATPDGQEPQLRARAIEQAKNADREAAIKVGTAQEAVRQRSKDVTAIEQLRRDPPRRTLPERPATATAADELAAQQEATAQAAGERLGKVEEHLDRIKEIKQEIGGRTAQFTTLLGGLPEAVQSSPTAEFTGSVDDGRSAAAAARQRMADANSLLSQAQETFTAAIDKLRRTSGDFPKISGPVKDRVMHDPADVLGRNATDLAVQLRLRASTLDAELAAIAKDQGILADSLAGVVRDSMETLKKAERSSQMGTAPGAWADRKVLRIGFERPDDPVLHAYAERVIERVIQKGLKPEGMPLLKEAVREAAGPGGFTVKVLKPTEDTTPVTEDISRLAKWSGGEKLTVCVALYCTIVALRGARTGRGNRPGGVLLLDNPIGRASSAHLVRLQRDVAAAHGVQLIYTTGVKDPAAVIQFPNVIRLDNRQGGAHGRRYIVADPGSADGTGGGLITGVRVAHTDRRWDSSEAAGDSAP